MPNTVVHTVLHVVHVGLYILKGFSLLVVSEFLSTSLADAEDTNTEECMVFVNISIASNQRNQ